MTKFFPKLALAVTLALSSLTSGVEFAAAHGSGHQAAISGVASWYGPGFNGRRTANGERFNENELTAAHRSLAFGTKVRVTNQNNGKSVVVRINDRGPYHGARVIDLSRQAARSIGMLGSGTAKVSLEMLA